MGWILRFALSFCAWTTLAWSVAWACSCIFPLPPLDSLAQADAVFVGTVVSREEPPPRYILYNDDSVQVISGGDMIGWRFLALRGWKGDSSQVVKVYTERDGAACGYPFQEGKSYLVYASSVNGGYPGQAWPLVTKFPVLTTHLCSRTRSMDRASADLAELGEPGWMTPASLTPPQLERASPNPSSGKVALRYEIPLSGRVLLSMHDSLGRRVAVVTEGVELSGKRIVEWDGRDTDGRQVASGTYFARLEWAGIVSVQKFVMVR